MPRFKSDKDSQIYKESDLKEVILQDVSPRSITSEIVSMDVIGELKASKTAKPIELDVGIIVDTTKRDKSEIKAKSKPKTTRKKSAFRNKLASLEVNSNKF